MTMVELSLMDAVSEIVDNRGRSCPTAASGFPLIATNCIRDDRLYPTFENIRHITQETYESWFRGHPEPNDIIFVCKGTPGRVALVPDPVPFAIAQDMVSLRADVARVHHRYLYYVLKSRSVRDKIANLHVGTMIPHFKKGDFGKLRFAIHENLNEQRAIAEVLGALDNKIAANAALAATSNSLVSALFSQASFALEFGSATFQELSIISGGGTPSTKVPDYWDGEVNWATPTDLTSLPGPYLESTSRRITPAGFAACSSKLFEPGAILMTSRATIGAIAVAHVATAVNQGFIVVEPHDPLMRYWLQHEMSSRVAEFESWANGATFLELSRGTFKNLKVRVPERQVLTGFNDKASALHAASRAALLENRTLAATRDALLPQLMSGRLRVRDAESLVADAV